MDTKLKEVTQKPTIKGLQALVKTCNESALVFKTENSELNKNLAVSKVTLERLEAELANVTKVIEALVAYPVNFIQERMQKGGGISTTEFEGFKAIFIKPVHEHNAKFPPKKQKGDPKDEK